MINPISFKELFINRASLLFNYQYNYDSFNYIDSKTKGDILCTVHDKLFQQTPNNHLRENGGCKDCIMDRRKVEIISKFVEKYGNKYNYDKFIFKDVNTTGIIICPEHGEFNQTPKTHLKSGCQKCSGYYRYSREEIIDKFIQKFGNIYDYGEFMYHGMKKNSCIICPTHGKFQQSASHHLMSITGCPKCSIGVTHYSNDIIDHVLINDNRTICRKGDYINNQTKIEWGCLVCGYDWAASPYEVLKHDKTGCAKCSKHVRLSNEIVDERIKNRDIIRLGNFITVSDPIEWLCKICEYKWLSTPDIIFDNHGCPNCAGLAPLTNAIIDEKLVSKNIKRLGDYVNNNTKIPFQCLICEHTWETVTKVLFNIGCGCPCCNSSGVNETKIRNFLKEKGFEFTYQQNIREICDIENASYRFDFYFTDLKIAIEYNGAQHYRPVKFGGISIERAEHNFAKQQKRDDIVRGACKNNNINLIEIDGRKYIHNKLLKYLETDIIPLLKNSINTQENLNKNDNN